MQSRKEIGWPDYTLFQPEASKIYNKAIAVHDNLVKWQQYVVKIKDLMVQHPYDTRLNTTLTTSETEVSDATDKLSKLQM